MFLLVLTAFVLCSCAKSADKGVAQAGADGAESASELTPEALEAVKKFGISDEDLSRYSWKRETYFGESLFTGSLNDDSREAAVRVPLMAVREDGERMYVIENTSGQGSSYPIIKMTEIYPSILVDALNDVEKKLGWIAFKEPENIAAMDDLKKLLSETFTPDFANELTEKARSVYSKGEDGFYRLTQASGRYNNIGDRKIEQVESSDDTIIYRVTVETFDSNNMEEYVPDELKTYDYVKRNIDGKWLFDRCELYY
jgi:hypothetical protein